MMRPSREQWFALVGFVLLAVVAVLGVFRSAEGAGDADVQARLARSLSWLRCDAGGGRGDCKALFERYYYDRAAGTCKPFFWGGCGEPAPFETAEECEAVCTAPKALRLVALGAVPDDIYAEVDLELPKDWEQVSFTVQVDGRELQARSSSGGFSTDRRMESLIFFPGKPGRKQVVVAAEVNGRRVEATGSLDWKPEPYIALIDHIGDRELILEKQRLALVTLNVDEPAVTFNGAAVKVEPFGQDAKFLRFEPSWVSGKNVLTVHGKGPDGAAVSRSFTFVHAERGTLTEGDSLVLDFGFRGSKSGPFYSTKLEGSAVVGSRATEVQRHVMSPDGWVHRDGRLVQELKAVKPGTSTVRILEKPHFLGTEEMRREIVLTVIPKP
jgi:hypothetical protein